MTSATQSPLGKSITYISHYKRELLFPIARKLNRDEIGVNETALPFKGCDIWNAYELSWLNTKGKPIVALAEFIFPCESPNLIESKSFKLYLNSFNNTKFSSLEEVTETLKRDLSEASDAEVKVNVVLVENYKDEALSSFKGICLDQLDVECTAYHVNPDFLTTENTIVTETLYSDVLKSNCLVTGQPDWASVQIHYTGNKINHEGLLKYIVSFRDHNEFHEQCVERIFADIMRQCAPQKLTVYARYTRRGGLDINPFRSTEDNVAPDNLRQIRQ